MGDLEGRKRIQKFQHLFFLTEVATLYMYSQHYYQDLNKFQHLFFLTEVATHHSHFPSASQNSTINFSKLQLR